MIKIEHSGLESALCKLPQEVKPHQEDEDIPGEVLEPVELIQPHKCGRCDQNDEDGERTLLHGVNVLQSFYFKMDMFSETGRMNTQVIRNLSNPFRYQN